MKIEKFETFMALQQHIDFFKNAEAIRTKWPTMNSVMCQECSSHNHGNSNSLSTSSHAEYRPYKTEHKSRMYNKRIVPRYGKQQTGVAAC